MGKRANKACKNGGTCNKNKQDCDKQDCGQVQQDCEQSAPSSPPAPSVNAINSIPVSVNVRQPAISLQQQPQQQQQLTSDNSPEAIRDQANRFYDLFERYDKLRILARRLNGLPQMSPYPAGVSIDKVDLTFTVDAQTHTAVIANSRIVGELAALIANELSTLIEQMHNEVFSLTHITAAMQKAIEDSSAKRATPSKEADAAP